MPSTVQKDVKGTGHARSPGLVLGLDMPVAAFVEMEVQRVAEQVSGVRGPHRATVAQT